MRIYVTTNKSECNIVFLQSVPIITKVVSSKPAHGEVNSIQQYGINFVSDLQHFSGFLWVLWFPPNKIDRHDITEILLKVVLNAIALTHPWICFLMFFMNLH
jgi:hypothetical protein